MIYDSILIDIFNIAYRKNTKVMDNDPVMIANAVINYIEGDVKSHLTTDGNLYLLFDPIPEILKSDLGLSKNFKYMTARQEISSAYKSNRVGNPGVIEALKLLRKFYTFKGEHVKTCICRSLEADDFVEGIVAKETGNIALITNDSDWARYISDRVHMINKDFDTPYTKTEYFNEFGVIPTIAGVILRKAIYGDETDCIKPIINAKKLYTIDNMEIISKNLIQFVTSNDMTIDEVVAEMKDVDYNESLKNSLNLTPISRFMFNLYGSDLINIEIKVDSVVETLFNNIRVIKSRCKDPYKYVIWKPDNPNYNKMLNITLNRDRATKKHSFGKIKL